MPRLLRELSRAARRGLLGCARLSGTPRTYYVVQDGEQKGEKRYAHAVGPDMPHRKARAVINRTGKRSGSTEAVARDLCGAEGGYESVHADEPAFGPAAATGSLPVEGRGRRTADRLAHRSPAK